MLSAGFGQLPVTTGGGGLAGIVAITDITAALRGALRMNSPAHEDPSAGR
jgi:CBS domain-containing protein